MSHERQSICRCCGNGGLPWRRRYGIGDSLEGAEGVGVCRGLGSPVRFPRFGHKRRGHSAAKELAQLRGLIEASTLRPHQLLSFQGVLIQSLYDAGLDAEALEFAPRVLAFNPNHPRTLLVSAKAEARQRNRDAALAYLSSYLEVMREADDSHVRVGRARQLYDKLAPSS